MANLMPAETLAQRLARAKAPVTISWPGVLGHRAAAGMGVPSAPPIPWTPPATPPQGPFQWRAGGGGMAPPPPATPNPNIPPEVWPGGFKPGAGFPGVPPMTGVGGAGRMIPVAALVGAGIEGLEQVRRGLGIAQPDIPGGGIPYESVNLQEYQQPPAAGIPNESIGRSTGVVAPENTGMNEGGGMTPWGYKAPAPAGMDMVPNKQGEMVDAAVTKSLGGIGEDGQLRSITGDVIPRSAEGQGMAPAGVEAAPNPWAEKFDKMLSDIRMLSQEIRPADSGYMGDTLKENIGTITELKALKAALPSVVGMAGVGQRGEEALAEAGYKRSLAHSQESAAAYHTTLAGIAKDEQQRKVAADNMGTMASTMQFLEKIAPRQKTERVDEAGNKVVDVGAADIGYAARGMKGIMPENKFLDKIIGDDEKATTAKETAAKAKGYNPPNADSKGKWWKPDPVNKGQILTY